MLLQMQKELAICADLKPEDVYFYYTTTSVARFGRVVKVPGTDCLHITQRLDDVELPRQRARARVHSRVVRWEPAARPGVSLEPGGIERSTERLTGFATENVQAPQGAPQPLYAAAHLLNWLATQRATVRLRIPGDLVECSFRFYHRSVL